MIVKKYQYSCDVCNVKNDSLFDLDDLIPEGWIRFNNAFTIEQRKTEHLSVDAKITGTSKMFHDKTMLCSKDCMIRLFGSTVNLFK